MAGAAFLFGIIDVALIATSDYLPLRGAWVVFGLIVGWGFIGTGLFAWSRRPENRVGMLMTATGFAWFIGGLGLSDVPVLFTFGNLLSSLYFAIALHMLLSTPLGTLHSRAERRLVAAAYTVSTVGVLPLYLTIDPQQDAGCDGCPQNVILVEQSETFANAWGILVNLAGVAIVIAVLVVLIRRWRRAPAPERRLYAPVYASGIALMVALTASLALSSLGTEGAGERVGWFVTLVPLALMPYVFLAALIRARMIQSGAVGELIARIGGAPRRGELRDALARALDDPSLDLVYWLPGDERFVDAEGRPFELPEDDPKRAVTKVEREGDCVAAIVYDASLRDAREHVDAVGAAAALALENERLDAALRAKVEELRASRQRMLRIGLEERRRLERDLHDGAQQRLVSMALNLRLARSRLRDDPDGAGHTARRRGRGARRRAGGAARAGPRHPSRRAERPRAGHRARDARPPGARAGGARGAARRAAPGGGGAGRVLRGVRGADQCGEICTGKSRHRERGPRQWPRGGGGQGRWRGRRRPGERHGPARPGRSARGDRGAPRRRLARRLRHYGDREDSVRVVVADDSVLLREGIVRLLEEWGFEVVGQAGDAEDLIRKVGAHKPDVAVVDIRMPPTNTDDGLRAALQIRADHPDTGVLVLSQYVEEGYALELVGDAAGGVGYLLKDRVADVERFIDSVKRVADGGSALDPEVVAQLVGRARREDPIDELTPREREVLELMAEGRSNTAIAEQMVVTERAVEKHVTSIFGKLGLVPASEDHRRVLAVLTFLRS